MNQDRTSGASETRPTAAESCARIGAELSNLLRAFAPSDEALGHFRAARVEVLKGLRAAIDARIEHLTQTQQKGKSITIE